MPTALLALADRVVSDSGEVALAHDALVRMARDGLEFHGHPALPGVEVAQYNRVSPQKLRVWEDDGEVTGPPPETHVWVTPEPWASLDVWVEACERLKGLIAADGWVLDHMESYWDRFELEMAEMDARGMAPVLRQIVYLVDDFRRRKVVYGVGRGSSCASLTLFLLGLNKVDPVRHGIPIAEFLR